ncbi:MAG: Fur family transcriptional regulator [Anaerolineales bacterium]|jgi:Fe2+ or Zn2+ uptake regulation protein
MKKADLTLSQLRSQGYRLTPQRLAILRILRESGGHLSPIEVYHQAKEVLPGITEATVYRTLSFLTEHDLALAAHIGSGQLVYEIAENDHDHLICRSCGKTHEVDHTILKSLYEQFEITTGYRIDSVHQTFFGLCPECQNK